MIKSKKNTLFVKEVFDIFGNIDCPNTIHSLHPFKHEVYDFRGYHLDALKLMVAEGERVKIGQPILHVKGNKKAVFASLAAGKIIKIDRGKRRVVEKITLEIDESEDSIALTSIDLKTLTKDTLVKHMQSSGANFRIFQRPLKRIADLTIDTDALFINASKKLPFALPLDFQLQNHKEAIEIALSVLQKFYTIHFISIDPIDLDKGIQCHQTSNNWQGSLTSWHLHKINPTFSPDQNTLTMDLEALVYCGYTLLGQWNTEKNIFICGSGTKKESVGIYKCRAGTRVDTLLTEVAEQEPIQIISADPLSGAEIQTDGSLYVNHNTLSILKKEELQRPLYHLRIKSSAFTATTGYVKKGGDAWLNNRLFGEPRAPIAEEYYKDTLPMDIDLLPLLKAILAEDLERAVFLGLLELDAEDLALPSFVCPSKIEMVPLIIQAQKSYIENGIL